MSLEGINVCIRVRPFIQREIDAKEIDGNDWIIDGENNSIQSSISGKKQMNFDRVFDNYATNSNVYDEAAKRIIDSAFEGVNGTVLAYGQTSSGKTFTMSSIMKQSFASIFKRIQMDKTRTYEVSASYCEVYNENITDLADPTKTGLSVAQDTGTVRDLTIRSFQTEQEVIRFHEDGTKNRRVGATKMNTESSRSHSILQVFIKSSPIDAEKQPKSALPQGVGKAAKVNSSGTLEATINFVDLAGSERASQTEAKGERLQEGAQINKSLLVLGKVIRSLASRKNEQPPYRESKLTQLLRRSLGGNCRTTMICCVTMAKSNVSETTSTLSFAVNAKNVVNTVGVNETLDDKQMLIRAQERYQLLKLKCIQFYDILKNQQNVQLSPEMDQFFSQLALQKGSLTSIPTSTSLSVNSTAALEAQLGALGAQLAGMGGDLVPISKKQRNGGADFDQTGQDLVSLGQIQPHFSLSIPIDTGMQTDFSLLGHILQQNGGQNGTKNNNIQTAKKRKSMEHDSDDMKSSSMTDTDMTSSSSVTWYTNPIEIQPNTAKIMELLGYTNTDESLSEFFDQNFAQLEDDLTEMLVSNGLFADTRGLNEQLDQKGNEIVKLKQDYDIMHDKFTQMVTELNESLQEEKTKSDSEILLLKNKIIDYQTQLQSFESNSTTHQLELQSTISQYKIDTISREQEIKQLHDQIEQMNVQHLEAISQFTEVVQSKEHIRMNEVQQLSIELDRIQAEYQQYKDDTELLLEEAEHDNKRTLEQIENEHGNELTELQKINEKLRLDHKSEYTAQMNKFEAVRNSLLDELQEVEEHNLLEYSQLETKFITMEEKYTLQVSQLQKQIELLNQKHIDSETKLQFLQQENDTKLELLNQLRQQKEKELQFVSERVKSVTGDKDKVITTMESELMTLRLYQQQQQTTYENLQSQYRLLDSESSTLKRETADLRIQITTKDYELQRIKQRAEEVAKKQRDDSETLVKRFKEKIIKINIEREVELEKKDNEILRLKELQQAFATKVKKSISEAKTERDEAILQVETKEKERRRLEHDIDSLRLRFGEIQNINIQLKLDLGKQKESNYSLETTVSEEASLKKFHIQENLILKKQLQQLEQRFNDHMATLQAKFDRDLHDRGRIIQNLESQHQQKQNELEYHKQTHQEVVSKMAQITAENQSLKMKIQQQIAMASMVAPPPPPSSSSSMASYSSSFSSTLPPSLSSQTSSSRLQKQSIYEDPIDMDNSDPLPRPFAPSTSYTSSLSNSPYKRMDLTKPSSSSAAAGAGAGSSASSRPKPEVVKFVGSRTTRATTARAARHLPSGDNHENR